MDAGRIVVSAVFAVGFYILAATIALEIMTEKFKWRDEEVAVLCAASWPISAVFWGVVGICLGFHYLLKAFLRLLSRKLRRSKKTVSEVK